MSLLTAAQSPSEKCSGNALGVEYERIPDDNMTSNKDDGQNPAPKGRLGHPSGWCTLSNEPVGYLQISLSTIFFICAVSTQGHFDSENYGFVETYRLQLSTSENLWDFYRNRDEAEVSNERICLHLQFIA